MALGILALCSIWGIKNKTAVDAVVADRGAAAVELGTIMADADLVPAVATVTGNWISMELEGTATTTLFFWTIAFVGTLPPYTRRVVCSTVHLCSARAYRMLTAAYNLLMLWPIWGGWSDAVANLGPQAPTST